MTLQEVPQGGVLSPTLFLVVINDIPKGIQGPMYADDFVLWCSEESMIQQDTDSRKD